MGTPGTAEASFPTKGALGGRVSTDCAGSQPSQKAATADPLLPAPGPPREPRPVGVRVRHAGRRRLCRPGTPAVIRAPIASPIPRGVCSPLCAVLPRWEGQSVHTGFGACPVESTGRGWGGELSLVHLADRPQVWLTRLFPQLAARRSQAGNVICKRHGRAQSDDSVPDRKQAPQTPVPRSFLKTTAEEGHVHTRETSKGRCTKG